MKLGKSRVTASMAALLIGASGLAVTPAQAAGTGVCKFRVGSTTAAGDHRWQEIVVDNLPPRTVDKITAPKLFPAGATRLVGDFGTEYIDHVPAQYLRGWQVVGSDMYWYRYELDNPNPTPTITKVGGGWGEFKTFNTSRYEGRVTNYALHNNGSLYRWSAPAAAAGPWRSTGTFTGFSSVKSLALFSQSATYDTLLALTSTGALYTIRIPLAAGAKPVTTVVRPAGYWKDAEKLITFGCGAGKTAVLVQSNLNDHPWMHLFGKASGTATTIASLDAVRDGDEPVKFTDPAYNRIGWGYLQGD